MVQLVTALISFKARFNRVFPNMQTLICYHMHTICFYSPHSLLNCWCIKQTRVDQAQKPEILYFLLHTSVIHIDLIISSVFYLAEIIYTIRPYYHLLRSLSISLKTSCAVPYRIPGKNPKKYYRYRLLISACFSNSFTWFEHLFPRTCLRIVP